MNEEFSSALSRNSLTALRAIPKSDLHSHAGRGGHVSYIEKWAGVKIQPPPPRFNSLSHMQEWFAAVIKPHCPGREGQLKRWEAAFAQCENDNISVLAMSFGTGEISVAGTIDEFIHELEKQRAAFAPNTRFLPELTFDRACDVDYEYSLLDETFSYNFFRSVDICGDESAQSIRRFTRIFRLAKSRGLVLKAHVGEFGSADDVMEAVEELELHEIHHGIAAAQSPQIMTWLAKNNIRLNVCPSSNFLLGLVKDYASHPIKLLYASGVPVTINTDDLLIFNQTLSQEYLNLFNAKLFSSDELDDIRKTGLNILNY